MPTGYNMPLGVYEGQIPGFDDPDPADCTEDCEPGCEEEHYEYLEDYEPYDPEGYWEDRL